MRASSTLPPSSKCRLLTNHQRVAVQTPPAVPHPTTIVRSLAGSSKTLVVVPLASCPVGRLMRLLGRAMKKSRPFRKDLIISFSTRMISMRTQQMCLARKISKPWRMSRSVGRIQVRTIVALSVSAKGTRRPLRSLLTTKRSKVNQVTRMTMRR